MKERNWKALAEELTDMLSYQTDETAVEVKVYKDQALELHPIKENSGRAFYHMDTVTDFCRCKNLSSYVSLNSSTVTKVICRIH
jgi:hypothetical protein